MSPFLIRLIATLIVAAILMLGAWLALSALTSFVWLDWVGITETPRGRGVYGIVAVACLFVANSAVAETTGRPRRSGLS